MNVETAPRHFLDRPVARLLAVGVALLTAALLVWLNRDALFGASIGADPALAGNPELAACLSERVGAVDKMRAEGIVNDSQYAAFRSRAEAYCQSQFPAE